MRVGHGIEGIQTPKLKKKQLADWNYADAAMGHQSCEDQPRAYVAWASAHRAQDGLDQGLSRLRLHADEAKADCDHEGTLPIAAHMGPISLPSNWKSDMMIIQKGRESAGEHDDGI